jgi:hypothetical protein
MIIPYKERLDRDRRWAMDQGGWHFHRKNDVFRTLYRLAPVLEEQGIAYAVMGGLALFEHGYERFSDDVDLIVTPESLRTIHDRVEALGCVRPFPDRDQVWDVETGVRIDFRMAGAYPGDGKPKSIAFPDPAEGIIGRDGVIYLSLPSLVELKLASGISGGIHRMRDLADAIELIKILKLPADFAEELNPFVRDRYAEYWPELQGPEREP